ncbi:hypothetical protein [Streptomyces sp. H27-D2]|uniref:hypothetical protein n=1 Tax=Streptomyces sp. H27-D2 TaxID=3046304 RepID=UPI002DB9CD09|nr:hypothetical protein [Streptomyces sp. H27-D2]MEC4016054.1 hypothetical protein [Streptomyces sp. H27-D2]
MDTDARWWALVEGDGVRLPLLSHGEAQAAVELLQLHAAAGEQGADVAGHLACALARRLPADDVVTRGSPRP